MRIAFLLALSMMAALSAIAADKDDVAVLAGIHTIRRGDTLMDIARAEGLGYVELLAANPGVDPWLPKAGMPLRLPIVHIAPEIAAEAAAPLVVNLGDMRLYRWGKDGKVKSYAIGIGRDGFALIPGTTTSVVRKRERPVWVPPPSVRREKPWLPRAVPPGPDNPLGEYSLDLGLGLIRIHGTNLPDGVGRRVSHGCIRLYPEDIEELFAKVAVGTRVVIVDQPAKLAWQDGELWLEVHPTQAQADFVENRVPPPAIAEPGLAERVARMAGPQAHRIDWAEVQWAERTRLGLPVRVTLPSARAPVVLAKKKPGAHGAGL